MNPLHSFFKSLHNALLGKSFSTGTTDGYAMENRSLSLELLWKPIRKYWQLGSVVAALTFSAAILSYPAPLIYRYLIDDVILAKDMERMPWAIAAVAGFSIAAQLLNSAMNALSTLFNRYSVLYLREILTGRMLSLPQSFFDRNAPGYIMSRLDADLGGVGWLLSSSPLYILENIIKLIGGLVFLFYLEWHAGLCVAAILPVFIWFSFFFSKRQYELAIQHSETYAQSGGVLEESISNINTVKGCAGEDAIRERLMKHYRRLFHIDMEQHVLQSFFQMVVNFFPQIARFLLLVFGGIWIIRGEWTLGSLIAAQAYLGFVFSPIQALSNAIIQCQCSLASLNRISQFYAITPEYNSGGRDVSRMMGSIAFVNVDFGYIPGPSVLREVEFSVAPGRKIAICGESGAGKSTLVALLMRFYLPQKGHILFDGEDAGIYDLKQLRQRIGYLSQEPQMFTATIADNIRMTNPDADDETVVRALRMAGLEEFMASKEQGIDFMLHDKGANLSVGQKKRLALARVLVANPDILIFDELTAGIDQNTSLELLEKLQTATAGKTVFMITHDPTVAAFCDKSLFIASGQLAGFARHADLADQNPAYRQLFRIGEH